MKFTSIYRCLSCNALIAHGDTLEITPEQAVDYCAKMIQHQQLAGNPYLYKAPLQIPHRCKDGSVGMAYFAGMRAIYD